MAETRDLDRLNRQIAADLLRALIEKGQLRLSTTAIRPDAVVAEVGKAYLELLAQITPKSET